MNEQQNCFSMGSSSQLVVCGHLHHSQAVFQLIPGELSHYLDVDVVLAFLNCLDIGVEDGILTCSG